MFIFNKKPVATIILTFIVFAGLTVFSQSSADFLGDFCKSEYQRTSQCPPEKCSLGCFAGINYEGCQLSCSAKSCIELTAKDCPLDSCQVLPGCAGPDVCYPKTDDTASCGGL